jgi:surface protein
VLSVVVASIENSYYWNVFVFLAAQFSYASTFNRNIGNWNVAAVTDMSYMVRMVMAQTNASCHLHTYWLCASSSLSFTVPIHSIETLATGTSVR